MEETSRRRFFENAAGLLAVAAAPVETAAAPMVFRKRQDANGKIGVAIVGVHGQGKSHVGAYAAMADVDVVAICDADTACFGPALEIVAKAGKRAPKTYQDVRRLLEDKDVHAISTATPNHWHALVSIWAMQSGRDVYCEKPATHQVLEGRRMVEAARKYGRICQIGTQSRSSAGLKAAMAYLHEGKLGKVHLARALCYKPRGSIGKVAGPVSPPATVDYDLWLGPAPRKPIMRERFHYDWHWQWDYGNGDLGNQGVHEMDKARWGLGKNEWPKSALGIGGRFGYIDDGETPNTELVFLDYGDCQLIFEVRGLKTDDIRGAKVGNLWYGEKGVMVVPNYSSATVYDNDGNKIEEFKGGGSHHGNFIEAVRSRKHTDLNCDVAEGALSATLYHLGNISLRLGKDAPFTERPQAFGDDREAFETFARFEDHLRSNGVLLEKEKVRVGRKLLLDPEKENCGRDRAADAMLTRKYRKGFEVPDKV